MNRKTLITITALLAILLGICPGSALAGVSIAPAYIEMELDKGRPAGTFLIKNTGNKEERYRINAVHFDINELGAYAISKPEQDQLGAWIRFNPKELVLPPLSERKVRFVVAPRAKLENGQYRAAMELESLEENKTRTESEGRVLELTTLTSILVPIFASYGELTYAAEPRGIELLRHEERNFLRGVIENTGNANIVIEANYVIKDSSGNVVDEGRLGRNHVLPGNKRIFTTPASEELQNGSYKVKVDYKLEQLDGNVVEEADVSLEM